MIVAVLIACCITVALSIQVSSPKQEQTLDLVALRAQLTSPFAKKVDDAECKRCIDLGIDIGEDVIDSALRLGAFEAAVKFCEAINEMNRPCIATATLVLEYVVTFGLTALDFDPVYVCNQVHMCPGNHCPSSSSCAALVSVVPKKLGNEQQTYFDVSINWQATDNSTWAGVIFTQATPTSAGPVDQFNAFGISLPVSSPRQTQILQVTCPQMPAGAQFALKVLLCEGGCDQFGVSRHGARLLDSKTIQLPPC